ncbi:MAG: YceI family protein [Bacteroidales bacterium]|nr:YceI family protein [Bacteroidales bacterium]
MKLKYVLLLVFSGLMINSFAQKHITKSGNIEIFSQTPLFTIEGVNKKVASILNTETGDIVASTLMRSFKFEEALVEEHFNENYAESHKFPKSTFKGKITDYKKIDFTKDGTHTITIEGKLLIHGATNYVKEQGVLTIKDGNISAKTQFNVSLKAFEIQVEKAYEKAIKDEIELKIHFDFKPYTK